MRTDMNTLLDTLHKSKVWLNHYLDPALQPIRYNKLRNFIGLSNKMITLYQIDTA